MRGMKSKAPEAWVCALRRQQALSCAGVLHSSLELQQQCFFLFVGRSSVGLNDNRNYTGNAVLTYLYGKMCFTFAQPVNFLVAECVCVCVCVSLGIACRVFCKEGNQKARTFCGLKGSHWNQMLKKHA